MQKRGFTLIELLVVIAIISILAAILFPVLSQARVAAKQAQCMVHMREIGLAMRMYTDDNDGTWPPAFEHVDLGGGFSPQQPWIGFDNANAPLSGGFTGDAQMPALHPIRPGSIDGYIKNHDLQKCPAQPNRWQLALAYNWFNPITASEYYVINPAAQGQEFGPGAAQVFEQDGYTVSLGAQDSQMEEPAATMVLWEHGYRVPICNFLQGSNWLENPPDSPADANLKEHFHFLHRGGSNVIWGDSHAKRLVYGNLKRRYFSLNKGIYEN